MREVKTAPGGGARFKSGDEIILSAAQYAARKDSVTSKYGSRRPLFSIIRRLDDGRVHVTAVDEFSIAGGENYELP